MGKRQVKNESALKEIRLPEEGELFGRVLKMMGGENVMIKCDDNICLLYTSPSPRDGLLSRMPSSA